MNKKAAYSLCSLVSTIALAPLAHAQLVTYEFNDAVDNGTPTLPAGWGSTSSGASVSAGDVFNGPGVGFTGEDDHGGATPYLKAAFTTAGFGNQTLNDAVTAEDYLTFTLTPEAGMKFDFTGQDLTFDLQIFHGSSTGLVTSTLSVGLFTSADSFTSQVGSTATLEYVDPDLDASQSGFTGQSISLSALGSLDTDEAVEFRLYFYRDTTGGTGTVSNRFGDIDNIAVNGAVVIPEPSTFGLLMGGLGLLTMVRRRR